MPTSPDSPASRGRIRWRWHDSSRNSRTPSSCTRAGRTEQGRLPAREHKYCTAQLQRGNLAAARKAFTNVEASDRRSSPAITPRLGVIAIKAGGRQRAFAECKQAVQTDPRNFDALFNLASELLAAGRTEEARLYVDQFRPYGATGAIRIRHRTLEEQRLNDSVSISESIPES